MFIFQIDKILPRQNTLIEIISNVTYFVLALTIIGGSIKGQ